MTDVLIRGASIVDGTGAPARRGDVAIAAGRIVALGTDGSLERSATRTIEADGLAVAPGFIDMHSHADFTMPAIPARSTRSPRA